VILHKESVVKHANDYYNLYSFHQHCDNEEMSQYKIPVVINNTHGKDVHQKHLDEGWVDITESADLLPTSIAQWLLYIND